MILYSIQVIKLLIKLSLNVKIGHVSGKKDIPLNMPAPCGLCFVVMERVDAEHDGDTFTQCSKKGFIIYVKSKPVFWMT